MFGERYFATRERLSAVVHGARELAEDTGTDLGLLADQEELLSGIFEPFLFQVLGEVNAGKSSFINGLFGTELCEVESIPNTKEVQWFCYGENECDELPNEALKQSYRASEFLRDFTVVDSPGSHALESSSKAVMHHFLPLADVVFFVFPVMNAWGASTWNLISELAPQLEGRIALVLQQKDQRNEQDLVVMREHMRELAIQKIGYSPDIFFVSGLQAFEAKQEEPFDKRRWKESGYSLVEEFISRKITQSPTRRQALAKVCNSTMQTLRDIEDRMEVRRRTLDSDEGFLSDIEVEVNQERERQVERLAEKFSGLAEVFGEQSEEASRWLANGTSPWLTFKSLFHKENTAVEIEAFFIEAVQSVVKGLAEDHSDELVAACRMHWRTVIPRIEERLEMPPPDFEKESSGFNEARARYISRLEESARKAVIAQKIRGMIDHELETQRSTFRRFVTLSLLVTTVAGLLGFFKMNIWAFALLACAVVLLVIGFLRLQRNSKELVEWFREKSSACRRPFAEQMSLEYEEGVRVFFVEYVSIFEDIRRHVADLSMKLKPQLELWDGYFLELKVIDQDL